jgi:hypothetical protein
MSLSDIVNITISKTTANISRAGFGEALILGTHMKFASRTQEISQSAWATELAALGFITTDPIYLAAQDMFAQNPAPVTAKIGLRTATTIEVTVDTATVGEKYDIQVESVTPGTFTPNEYTAIGGDTTTDIAVGLKNAINANAESPNVLASNLLGVVTITRIGTSIFAVKLDDNAAKMTVGAPGSGGGSVEASNVALAAIVVADDDWYGLCTVDDREVGDKADQLLIMAWAESNRKLFIAATSDPAMLTSPDTTSVAYTASQNAYAYTAVIYHSLAATEYADAAWLGNRLPYDPGSQTWAFKTLASITVDTLSTSQRTAITSTSGNFYVTEASVNATFWGTTGEDYIDITRGIDWLRIRMQEDLVALMLAQAKIPFTDKGIAMVEAKIQKRLQEGVRTGLLAPLSEDPVTVPLAEDVSTANKTARTLTGVTFTADLAGAIHEVTVTGTVSV